MKIYKDKDIGPYYVQPKSGDESLHIFAITEPGFSGYLYSDNHLRAEPGIFQDNKIELPVAWKRIPWVRIKP